MIELKTVTLGNTRIRIPVWDQQSTVPGKTIVITAGMDGDEYASIEAAYDLIEIYSKENFSGRLIILPLVNIPGFDQAVSLNPLDNKYPKYIYPGKKNGSSTEQLLYYLSENYISHADIWIDLHGGALIENLNPLVWTWQTKNVAVNELTKNILSAVQADIKIFDKDKREKVQTLAKHNTAYVLLESGQLGERNVNDIIRHVEWVKTIIGVVNGDIKPSNKKISVYTKVNYHVSTQDGLWYPKTFQKKEVEKDTVLGDVISFTGKHVTALKTSQKGVLLWWRGSLNAKKKEVLAATATDLILPGSLNARMECLPT